MKNLRNKCRQLQALDRSKKTFNEMLTCLNVAYQKQHPRGGRKCRLSMGRPADYDASLPSLLFNLMPACL